DGSLVGVRIASAKITVPHAGAKGAADEEENRERARNASREWDGRGAGPARRADADGDGDDAPGSARLGPWAGAGGPGRALSRGGSGPGRGEGAAPAGAHPSALGDGGDRADVRGPARADVPPAGAGHPGRRSALALGGPVSGPRSADRADDATAAGRGVDAPVRGESRGPAK